METEGNLLQKMKNVFSDNEDKEKIAEEIIEKVLEGYEKGIIELCCGGETSLVKAEKAVLRLNEIAHM